ncbi:CDP-glucose 4,6-dehydratase [Thalassospira marina]|uniref:CDP-glucose 4,6-dehydratase n=2 Tax=Thalassospira marina TaxID=2048283 RepID=A0ABN5FM97_9PROT|nr:CDP-glucose 4,6-dehydratase [Thalassospira marina]
MENSLGFWHGKRVLLTGHTGFKGGWLALWLKRLGAELTGVALPPESSPNLFTLANISEGMGSYFCDIRNRDEIKRIIRKAKPEIVFHLAAQPLVRESYTNPVETFDVNIMGTAHVLDGLRDCKDAKVAIIITTDKVYHNNEWSWPYREEDKLGGYDPYSASKAASELVVASYRDAFLREQGVRVATARAGNVIGGGDWSEDRLLPDAVRAWQAGDVLEVRRPDSVRPWQHVLEPLSGYLNLAEKLWLNSAMPGAYNFGPETSEAASVKDVIELAKYAYGRGEVRYCDTVKGVHEAGWLALEISKSRTELGMSPKWPLKEALQRTMHWYRAQNEGQNPVLLCEHDILAFEAAP